ncbi:tryptophan halogenase family protein [Brevundimonas sp.]|uniref:tryptophan halogenase family protein n=1 Tax=Brevundimonas sp. TaxID=1871086 RepID=UPI002737F2EE|nr:tryptophan halogenase family protein [Brevundimonas sp.]MDP3801820.1 tryptophan 7-halogenase [Brevundimonas sp.]
MDMTRPGAIRSIAIVGGGTAGWMSAVLLGHALRGSDCRITVVESAEIGIVGVGEATIPPILDFLDLVGIDRETFVRETQATIKLGIRFQDWKTVGEHYWHPFGSFGCAIDRRPFHHHLQRAAEWGEARGVTDFSLGAAMAQAGRFAPPDPRAGLARAGLRHALHFDASLVARTLRTVAERRGIERLERTVVDVTRTADGHVGELLFSEGEPLAADLFIDCSGFRGLLIEGVMASGYEDWTHWLPCDRAVAGPTALAGDTQLYTLSQALGSGWRWRIPLQHRVGNGYVYSSSHLEDQPALDELARAVGGDFLAEPRQLRFTTGRRRAFWKGNVVALGLASGFMEPLESTSIHLVTSGLYKLLDHFPDRSFEPANIAAYNAALIEEYETIRDFILVHYCLSERRDTPFWRDVTSQPLPDSLKARIDLYRASGRCPFRQGDLFVDVNWYYVLHGLGLRPRRPDPLTELSDPRAVRNVFDQLARDVQDGVAVAQ